MNRRIAAIIAWSLFTCIAAVSSAQGKLDPYLSMDARVTAPKALSISVVPPAPEIQKVDVFIKSSDPKATAAAVRAAGGLVRAQVGRVLTASVPQDALARLADRAEVVFIEAAKPIIKMNDVAVGEIGVPEVHAGIGLTAGLTGSGVIVGLIDTGIDYRHEDFLDAEGRSRVLAIWDQTRSSGPSPAELGDSYGTECNAESIAGGTCSMRDVEGHGSHVAGIAAGSDETYGGVAPDANIIVVKYDASLDLESGYANPIFSTKICEAVFYVFAKASSLGMPAVANLSLGTHIGAHDGTSLFEECLDAQVEGKAGRAIVAAAGNEYSADATYTGIHAAFAPGNTTQASNFVIRSLTRDRVYYIDFWESAGSQLSVGLALHNGTPGSETQLEASDMVLSGESLSGEFLDGKVKYLINASETSSPLNGRPHVGIRITVDAALTQPDLYSFDLIVSGTGTADAWLFPDKPARTIQFTTVSGNRGSDRVYVAGDRVKNVAIPATASDVIAVAGYTTRNRWTAGSLSWTFSGQELGSVLSFSSSGPSAAPGITGTKPEIAAPGGMIASTLSSAAAPAGQTVLDDGKHFLQAGTSMAAPYVAGTIALMFQMNPNFTSGDAEGFLVAGAYKDEFVGMTPNDRWGAGKLDVLKAIELAANGAASGVFDATGSLAAPKSGGSSSCTLQPTATAASFAELVLMACGLAALAGSRRRSR